MGIHIIIYTDISIEDVCLWVCARTCVYTFRLSIYKLSIEFVFYTAVMVNIYKYQQIYIKSL